MTVRNTLARAAGFSMLALLLLPMPTIGTGGGSRFLLPAYSAQAGEDRIGDYNARQRISDLILSLDVTHAVREKLVRKLLLEAHGPNAPLVRELLVQHLPEVTDQARLGIIEVMTLMGNPDDLPFLQTELRYDGFLDTRIQIIRTLPVFRIGPDPKLYGEIYEMLNREPYQLTGRARALLRARPRDPGSDAYDAAQDRVNQQVEAALSEQLDPVGTMIEGISSRRDGVRANDLLREFCPSSLGNTQADWRQAWQERGLDYESPRQHDLDQIRSNACRMLADIGAECTEPLAQRLRHLMKSKNTELARAGADCLREIAAVALERRNALLQQRAQGAAEPVGEEERAWMRRQLEAADRARSLAREQGSLLLTSELRVLREAGYLCLGAAKDPQALPLVRKVQRERDEDDRMQVVIAQAVADIGSPEAVRMLTLFTTYRGVSADPQEQAREYRRVWSAFAGLAQLAGETDPATGLFRCDDPDTGRLAFGTLLRHIDDLREMSGAPRNADGSQFTIRQVILNHLRRITGNQSDKTDAQTWSTAYETKLASWRMTVFP